MPPQSALLVALAENAFNFYMADDGKPFAVDPTGPNVALPLRGARGIRSALAHLHQVNYGKPPNAAALTDALLVLEGKASQAKTITLPLRVARHGDGLVLDLGDNTGTAVAITSSGWEELKRSPVTFRRTALTGPLPTPREGGDLNLLRVLVNVADRSWSLVVGALVAALLPDIPHPVIAFLGEQGTGKSTCARLLVQSIDAGPAPLRTAPRDVESWVVAAAGSHVVVLDNVSSIQPWLSDALCRAATGDGLVRRMLYSDSDLSVLTIRRVVMLTSIDAGALRGDLADRLLTVECETITPTLRRTDAAVEAAFQAARPAILGALLDLVALVLAELPNVVLAEHPRMADYARVLAAIDNVTGSKSLAAYLTLGDTLAEDVVDSDAVATRLRDFAEEHGDWEGTAAELLVELITPDPAPKDWPATPRSLSGAIRRCAPALRKIGVSVAMTRESGGDRRRLITITKTDAANGERADPHADPDSEGVRNGASLPSGASGWDGRDGRDANIATPAGGMFDDDRVYEPEVAGL